MEKKGLANNSSLPKVAVQCSADTFVVNQSLVHRINICSESRHLRQAAKRCPAMPRDTLITLTDRQKKTEKPTLRKIKRGAS